MEHISIKTSDRNGRQRVYLKLPDKSYKSTRQIGYIKDQTFYTYRNSEHIFKKLNAIGLNYELLRGGGFEIVNIQFGTQTLECSREYFLANGEFLHFKNNGLERQIFLELSKFSPEEQAEWNKNKIEVFNEAKPVINSNNGQLKLF